MFRRNRPLRSAVAPARIGFELELRQAHALFDSGEYSQAGLIFERLGGLAATRGGPRAPRFYVQAGRAWLHAGQVERGMSLLLEGQRIALASGTSQLLAPLLVHLQTEFLAIGLMEPAHQIAAWLTNQGSIPSTLGQTPQRKPLLPLKCPSCGAAVLSAEIVWLDENTAECAYCASPLRGG
jgi:hypothetical protein